MDLRQRWAGRLVLDASSRLVNMQNLVQALSATGLHGWTIHRWAEWILDMFPWLLLYAPSGRLEFRQSGIVAARDFAHL